MSPQSPGYSEVLTNPAPDAQTGGGSPLDPAPPSSQPPPLHADSSFSSSVTGSEDTVIAAAGAGAGADQALQGWTRTLTSLASQATDTSVEEPQYARWAVIGGEPRCSPLIGPQGPAQEEELRRGRGLGRLHAPQQEEGDQQQQVRGQAATY